MNQETNVGTLTVAGAIGLILVWLLAFFFPELMATAPIGLEGAIVVIIAGVGGWVIPSSRFRLKGTGDGTLKTPWWVVLLVLVLFTTGCANFNNAIGATYLARQTAAETVTAECGNTVPDGPCVPSSVITTDQKQAIKLQLQDVGGYLRSAQAINAGRSGSTCSDKWDCIKAAQGMLDVIERLLVERGIQ